MSLESVPFLIAFSFSLAAVAAALAPAQASDDALRDLVETKSWTHGLPESIAVADGGRSVVFLRSGPRDRELAFYAFDLATRTERRLAPRSAAATSAVTVEEAARRERQRITATGVAWYVLSEDRRHAVVPLNGLTVIDVRDGSSTAVTGSDGATDPKFSPDGRWVAFVREHDVWIADWRKGEARAVTRGGTEDVSHGEAEFVAQEEMDREAGYWWSPDSAHIAWEESDTRAVESVFIADPANPTAPPRSWKYPRAGRANAVVRLAVTAIDGGATTWVAWDRERFPYLAIVAWTKNAPLTLVVQSRDQREEAVLAADPVSGALRELLRETDPAWVALRPSCPRWLSDGKSFLWMSEADGAWRLTRRDAAGRPTAVLNAEGTWLLRDLVHVDEARGVAVVTGSDDARQQHLYEVPLAGGPARRLTSGGGWHDGFFEEHTAAHAVSRTSLTESARIEVFREDGSSAGWLPSVAEVPPGLPSVEFLRVGEGVVYDAAVVRPRAFERGKKYPVLVFVYGGPSDGQVHDALSGTVWHRLQWYADRGFIVLTSDNRGLENRGRAWSRAIAGSFGEIPLEDQVAALRGAAARVPEMDLSRVGIFGWSFGGFMSALAVAKRGDVFRCAVAGAPVTDWSEYDTHYTERYLGLPSANADGYARSSVLTYAKDLKRPLLIVHGTADDNVYVVHSMKLAERLFAAGIPFDYLPIAGVTHQVAARSDVMQSLEKRTEAFFEEQLR